MLGMVMPAMYSIDYIDKGRLRLQKARHIFGYMLVALVALVGVLSAALSVNLATPTTAEVNTKNQGHMTHARLVHQALHATSHAGEAHPSAHQPNVKDHSAHSLSECLVVCAEAAADPSLLPVANSPKRTSDALVIDWHQATTQLVPAVGKWVARLARGPPGEVPYSLSYSGAQRVLMRHAPLRI